MVVKKTITKKPLIDQAKKAVAKIGTKTAAAPVKKGAFGRPVVAGAAKKAPVRKAAPAKRKPVLFAAPADFKPHFLLIEVHSEKDGLIGGNVGAVRYMGRFDPAADDKKKSNMAEYDQDTLRGIAARLAAITFKTNADRVFSADPSEREGVRGAHRLPRSTVFHVLVRVGSRKADGSIMCPVRAIYQRVQKKSTKTGKVVSKSVALTKTDPVSRMLRRVGRILPAAFKNVLMPPKKTRGSRKEEAEE